MAFKAAVLVGGPQKGVLHLPQKPPPTCRDHSVNLFLDYDRGSRCTHLPLRILFGSPSYSDGLSRPE